MGGFFVDGNTIYFEESGLGIRVSEVTYFRIAYYLTFHFKNGEEVIVKNQEDIKNFKQSILRIIGDRQA